MSWSDAYDIFRNVVFISQENSEFVDLSISDLKPGSYILEINQTQHTSFIKL